MSVCICPSPGCPMEPSPCRLGYNEWHEGDYSALKANFDHTAASLRTTLAALRAAETKLAAIQGLAQLWTASDNVDDLHTRTTNRAYAGVLLDVLHREGALDE